MAARTPAPGDVVLVTGAASGMGNRLALRWAERGARVVGVDRDAQGLERLAKEPRIHGVQSVDVRDADAVATTVAEVRAEVGPIDVLVNAAGIAPMGRIGSQPIADLHRAMAVNYLGTANMVDQVLAEMLKRDRGTIINFASIAGWITGPGGGAYSASKAAVVAYTEALAGEVRTTGLRVLAVCPPTVDTPMLAAIRASGEMPDKAFEFVKPTTPDTVVDAIEAALGGRKTYVFPGRGTGTMIRVARTAPWLMRRLTRTLYGV